MGKKAMRVIGGVLGAAAAVLAGCAIAYPNAARCAWDNLTAGPVPLDESTSWDGGASYIGVPYAAESPAQYLDLYVPAMPDGEEPPLFVIIHGGGFVTGDSQTRQAQLMYRYFRDRGYACASINYRLVAEEPFPGAIVDCKAAIRFLRAHAGEYGYDASRIAVFGESAGGYLAIMCAVTSDGEFCDMPFIGQDEPGDVSAHVDVLVDYYGHADNDRYAADWAELGIPGPVLAVANSWASPELLMGYEDFQSAWFRRNVSEMSPEEKAVCDPHAYIDANDLSGLSVWIIHGDADITVPYLQSERLAAHFSEKLGAGSVAYTLVPGMGHASDPLYADEVLQVLESYLDEHMR